MTKVEKVDGRRKDLSARRNLVALAHSEGMTAKETVELIAEELGETISTATVSLDRKALGLARQNGKSDKYAERKRASAEKKVAVVKDRRRHKTVPVPFGDYGNLASLEAVTEARTIFPTRVFEPSGAGVECVLKDGCNNSKIGGDVLLGRLKGAYICTLTLEERATCPTSCHHWTGCYGNSMQHARRWQAGEALEAQLREEVALACAANEKVLIRLHVLGDFYSRDYVCLWAELLDTHDNLFVFGFTAWDFDTEIGKAIATLRKTYPQRFMIRVSGRTGIWGSFTLPFPTTEKTIGDAIVCPEQLDAMEGSPRGTHCGSCAVCWSCDRPIAFIRH